MIEKQPLSDQAILDCLNAQYGLDVAKLTFLPLGADPQASVYKAEGKRSYFVKVKQGQVDDLSAILMALLSDGGIQEILPPLKTRQGKSLQPLGDFTLTVYPFVEGEDAFSRTLTDEQWTAFGTVLKRVHAFKAPLSVQKRIRRETYSPKWRQIVRSLYPHFEGEPKGDEAAVKLLQVMKKEKTTIHKIVDRAEQLAEKVQHPSPEFVLCHSDIHGGNVLIDKRGTFYLVDWDEPIMAPKERDLMFIGGGVANVWNNPHEERSFYQGYGKTEINRPLLAYYRLERIVEDIAIYGQAILLSSSGGNDRQEMVRHFSAMFEPRGVAEIALQS